MRPIDKEAKIWKERLESYFKNNRSSYSQLDFIITMFLIISTGEKTSDQRYLGGLTSEGFDPKEKSKKEMARLSEPNIIEDASKDGYYEKKIVQVVRDLFESYCGKIGDNFFSIHAYNENNDCAGSVFITEDNNKVYFSESQKMINDILDKNPEDPKSKS